MTLWRISNHADLFGLGGERSDGRWHTSARGRRIVYFSEHPALALLEVLANLRGDPKSIPDTFQLIRVTAATGVSTETLDLSTLQPDWRHRLNETQSAGNSWLINNRSALLGVPSAPSPESTNYLFNPLHADARGLTMEYSRLVTYDKRLFHIS